MPDIDEIESTLRITVLGCNGSITEPRRTTCYQVDDDILIDAGTGAGDLNLPQVAAIDHVFLTHSHLDHCCMLPLLADAAIGLREAPVMVHALPETIASLQAHMFNGQLWPDYTRLPSPDRPCLRFMPIETGVPVVLGGRRITPLPARHAVPCAGYQVDSGRASWVYSGDTTLCPEFWQALNRIDNLRHLLVETTFLNANAAGAARSGHMTAALLQQGLQQLQRRPQLYIVHMEAGREEQTLAEIAAAVAEFNPQPLQRGHQFEL